MTFKEMIIGLIIIATMWLMLAWMIDKVIIQKKWPLEKGQRVMWKTFTDLTSS